MRKFYSHKLCVAVSGCINLHDTILVMHNNYTCSSHVYVQQHIMDIHSKDKTLLRDQCSSTAQVVVSVMAMLCYFQSTASLPTAKETMQGDIVI